MVGVPFSWEGDYLEKTLTKINFDKDKPAVLLYHLPSEFKATREDGIDLQLSGHTHAGQFFPFNYFVGLPFSIPPGTIRGTRVISSCFPGNRYVGPAYEAGFKV